MSLYMFRAQYTPEAFKGMLARPADREGPAKAVFDAAGLKLQHIWYSAKGEIICVAEGDSPVAGAAVAIAVMASGSLCNASFDELLTTGQQLDAMNSAREVAGAYHPPGK